MQKKEYAQLQAQRIAINSPSCPKNATRWFIRKAAHGSQTAPARGPTRGCRSRPSKASNPHHVQPQREHIPGRQAQLGPMPFHFAHGVSPALEEAQPTPTRTNKTSLNRTRFTVAGPGKARCQYIERYMSLNVGLAMSAANPHGHQNIAPLRTPKGPCRAWEPQH